MIKNFYKKYGKLGHGQMVQERPKRYVSTSICSTIICYISQSVLFINIAYIVKIIDDVACPKMTL